ncbi:MAG: class I adenylate-forming enzyme family protein, partial [Bdellovibrionota bacterium]
HGGEYDTSFTPPPENRPVETDVVLLLRTAGTTGKPRYVQFTHKQLAHAAMAMKSHYHLLGTDRFLTTMSWFHPFPFTHHMLFPLMSGACVVIDHGLQAVEFLDFLVDSRVTRLIGTPPFYLRLLVTCKNEKRMLPGIKSITVGLGLLEAPLMRAFTLLKVAVSHCYGQAENLWTLAMQDTAEPGGMSAEGAYEKGFVGKGMIGLKYKVVDDQGDEVEGKEDRMGQLCATSPMIMTGYMDLEKEQKQKIRGTWLYTGDIAKLTGDGDELRITYIGRKDDILMVEGKPIIMSQIDQVLRACPSLSDAAAFSIKNSKGKPVIVCAAVKKAGAQVNEKQVVDFASTHLAAEMMPIAVAFTDTIPRDLGNNVNCSKLRGQFSGIGG